MKHLIVFGAVASLAASVAGYVWLDNGNAPPMTATLLSRTSVSQVGGKEGGPTLKEETREQVGAFDLSKGHNIRLSTAETVDGMACLIEEDEGVTGSSCLEKGFFTLRKAELLVSSQGGPERFDELHATGIVAPGIRAAVLVKTDGSAVELRLNPHGAFAFESTEVDLEARIYPTGLRLYGPSRKLVETVTFPPAG